MQKLLYILLFFILSLSSSIAQSNSTIDSLKQMLKTAKHDTLRLRILGEMVEAEADDKIWPLYNEQMKNTAENILATKPKAIVVNIAKKYLAEALNNIGYIYGNKGNVPKSLDYFNKSLQLQEEIGDKKGLASSLNNVGYIYHNQGDIPKALKNYSKSLHLHEEIGDKQGVARSLNNIGLIYQNQDDLSKALEYFKKSLKIRKEIGDKKAIAISLINIGNIYQNQGNHTRALEYTTKSLKIQEEIGDKQGVAGSLNNIGNIYKEQGDIFKSLEYMRKSLQLFEEIGDKRRVAAILKNIGTIYFIQNQSENAKNYFIKSYQLSKELGYPDNIEKSARGLKMVYEKLGNYQLAYQYYQEEIEMHDSIQSEVNYKASAQQQAKYEYEKQKVLDDAENNKLIAIEKEAKAKQKVITYATAGGLGLVAIFLIFVFNRLQVTKKQKYIITQQKHLVEEKHKEITDSINYAERIQRSFLATTEMLDQHLKDYFVFFRPKDVVSGDFYWAGELNNGNFAFSVADSTVHGVPGAIMSILNISSLEKSIEKETEPDKILNQTRKIIIERLKKDGSTEGGKDGMDCSLLVINKDRTQLSFASANNPVFIIRPIVIASKERTKQSVKNEQIAALPTVARNDGSFEFLEFKPDKMPVGKHDNDAESFTLHTALLQKGDVIYALTDGFPDQFGGDKGKKYMIKNLKELLLQIAHLPMLEQEQKLAEEFDKWKGSNEQVDDVCIIGVRI